MEMELIEKSLESISSWRKVCIVCPTRMSSLLFQPAYHEAASFSSQTKGDELLSQAINLSLMSNTEEWEV